jgi:hypothetical protein
MGGRRRGSGLRRMAAQGFSPMPWVERGEEAGTITGRVGAIGEALWVEGLRGISVSAGDPGL